MRSNEELQTMVQVATMYYKSHLNQQEIADKLGTTRQTVSKLLKNAESSGVIEFRINNPLEQLDDLAAKLEMRFSLKKAMVIPCRFTENDLVAMTLAPYAGEHIVELVNGGLSRVGLAWGRTIYNVVPCVPATHCEEATVFPLVGASNKTAPYFMVNDMARRVADALNASLAYAYIPANPGSPEDAALFRRTSTYETISAYWRSIELAIVGIGSNPREEVSLRAAYPGEGPDIVPSEAVGDILTHYFDERGQFIETDAEILCASVSDLRRAKRVFAVAAGREKVSAIAGALKTGIVTDLLTDEHTCKRLLRA